MKKSLLLALFLALGTSVANAQPTSQQMTMDVTVEELLFLEQSHVYEVCEPFLGDFLCEIIDNGITGSVELTLARDVDDVGNVDWDDVDEEEFTGNWFGLFRTQLRYGTNDGNVKEITVASDIAPLWDTEVEAENLEELITGITSVQLGTISGPADVSTTPQVLISDIQQAFGEAELVARVQADPTEVAGSQSLTLTYTIQDQ